MPYDLIVTSRWEREAVLIGNVAHAATWEGEGNSSIYIWCFGESMAALWKRAPEGVAVQCLRCLAYGPRGDWQPHPLGRIKFDVVEGRRIGVVDTETEP